MRANQGILHSQIAKYTEQIQRLVQSDVLVRQLYAENETLVMAIQTLEDSIREASSSGSEEDAKKGSKECLDVVQEALLAKCEE